jgi:natural product precursor
MKKLEKLRLRALNEQNLAEKQMNALRGGDLIRQCTCSCQGSSSSFSNRDANYKLGSSGGYSTSGCQQYSYGYDTIEGYIFDDCSFCNESYTYPYYI